MKAPETGPQPDPWLATYVAASGAYDELLDEHGNLRPKWEGTLDAFRALGAEEINTRQQQARREIAREGITYNPHGDDDSESQSWQLDPFPLVMAQSEWDTVSAGIAQWANLSALLLQDLFGEQRLLADRVLPPDVLYGHPAWHPAYQGAHNIAEPRLHLCASDIARSADGNWWSTGLRTRAPFGLGYVIENRLMMSRLFPEIYRTRDIHRVASFFVALRDRLRSLAPRPSENPRIVLWSEGPEGPSYFEDAYLARYLNYSLVLSDDLAVRQNRVMLKTLHGLLPVDVLFRRLDDEACDSVELNQRSTLGVPGLTETMRANNIGMANGLGCGLLEAPALYAFAQSLAESLLGESLKLPPVATWWCGEKQGLDYVIANLDALLIRPAFAPGGAEATTPALLSAADKKTLIDRMHADPGKFVGQEHVARSVTPVWGQNGLHSRSLGLRAYCVATEDGFETLRGGLADVSMPTAGAGGRSHSLGQDVWVISDTPVAETTLLPLRGHSIELVRHGGDLPSRVCDNLFWLGRNLERVEGIIRYQRVARRITSGEYESAFVHEFLSQTSVAFTGGGDAANETLARDPEFRLHLESTLFDPHAAGGLQPLIAQSVRLASTVRDRIAIEMWRSVRDIDDKNDALCNARTHGSTTISGHLDSLLAALNGFVGLTHESMTRTESWSFLDMGKRIERAYKACDLIGASLTSPIADERGALELLLEIADSIMTYRGRYLSTVQTAPVLDLLLTDESNPRSIAHQLARLHDHVGDLRGRRGESILGADERLSLSMLNWVRLADVHRLADLDKKKRRSRLSKQLEKTKQQLVSLSDVVSSQYLVHAGAPRHFGLAAKAGE